jgi:tRNA(Arg) A34 adenosine deaminase TadA
MSLQSREDYMREAIRAAKEAQLEGGVAIGAVLVEESTGKVIARGGSTANHTNDPTAHAEVNCIKEAAKKLKTNNLHDYTIYTTLESCHMCLSAAAWARIPRIFFGAYHKDVDSSLVDIKGKFHDEDEAKRMNLRDGNSMVVKGGILEKECVHLLDSYNKQHKSNSSTV